MTLKLKHLFYSFFSKVVLLHTKNVLLFFEMPDKCPVKISSSGHLSCYSDFPATSLKGTQLCKKNKEFLISIDLMV